MREKMCDPDRISKSGVFSTRYNRTGINVWNMTRVSVALGEQSVRTKETLLKVTLQAVT